MATCNGLSVGNKGAPLKKMECLVCFNVVFPPVMQCRNWHYVCNNCREQLKCCPHSECEEDLGSFTRSAVAEKFLEKYVLRCHYFKDGIGCTECNLKTEKELMVAHEAICHFREVKCLVPGCYKQVRLTGLRNHFEKDHSIPSNTASRVQFDISELIMGKQSINERCGERSWKTFPGYAVESGNLFLAIFRTTSFRSPIFEISTIVHGYYPEERKLYFCKIFAKNTMDYNACFKFEGPLEQTFPLIPILSLPDELGRLKWIVEIDIIEKK